MTWADFFSSQIFGIIVGALITTGFTWFLDWRKSVREQKFRSIEKRNEAYFAVFDVFFGLLDTDFNGVGEVYDEHIVGKYEKTHAASPPANTRPDPVCLNQFKQLTICNGILVTDDKERFVVSENQRHKLPKQRKRRIRNNQIRLF